VAVDDLDRASRRGSGVGRRGGRDADRHLRHPGQEPEGSEVAGHDQLGAGRDGPPVQGQGQQRLASCTLVYAAGDVTSPPTESTARDPVASLARAGTDIPARLATQAAAAMIIDTRARMRAT
jgi:hypothetical protein